MTKYKAKYIGCKHEGWQWTLLFYEYRGYEYMITKSNNGYMESLKNQHEREQRRIDKEIEDKNKPQEEWKYEGSAQEAFDEFWKYVEEV